MTCLSLFLSTILGCESIDDGYKIFVPRHNWRSPRSCLVPSTGCTGEHFGVGGRRKA